MLIFDQFFIVPHWWQKSKVKRTTKGEWDGTMRFENFINLGLWCKVWYPHIGNEKKAQQVLVYISIKETMTWNWKALVGLFSHHLFWKKKVFRKIVITIYYYYNNYVNIYDEWMMTIYAWHANNSLVTYTQFMVKNDSIYS